MGLSITMERGNISGCQALGLRHLRCRLPRWSHRAFEMLTQTALADVTGSRGRWICIKEQSCSLVSTVSPGTSHRTKFSPPLRARPEPKAGGGHGGGGGTPGLTTPSRCPAHPSYHSGFWPFSCPSCPPFRNPSRFDPIWTSSNVTVSSSSSSRHQNRSLMTNHHQNSRMSYPNPSRRRRWRKRRSYRRTSTGPA